MWFPSFWLKGIPMWNHYCLWCDFMWHHSMMSWCQVRSQYGVMWCHMMKFVFVSQSITKRNFWAKGLYNFGNEAGMWTLRHFHYTYNFIHKKRQEILFILELLSSSELSFCLRVHLPSPMGVLYHCHTYECENEYAKTSHSYKTTYTTSDELLLRWKIILKQCQRVFVPHAGT